MKFGIIGPGHIGRIHAAAIKAMGDGSLHSICGRSAAGAGGWVHECGAICHTDLAKFLADDRLEIVTIATPSGAHFEPALAALEAGKHVVCEKPLEISNTRIDRLAAAAAANGKVLAAILNRRFTPAMSALKEACDAGRFGKIVSASCYVKWFRDQAYYDSAAWRGTLALDGGGALMNQAIHAVDSLLYLAGPVRWVQANTACLAHERIEVEDIAVAMLEFENGARGVIEATTCAWSQQGHPARIQICGTEGSVFLADESVELWEFKTRQEEDDEIRASLAPKGAASLGGNDPAAISFQQHQRNFEEIVAAIRENRPPLTSAAEARKAVALIEAVYQSAANDGKRVFL